MSRNTRLVSLGIAKDNLGYRKIRGRSKGKGSIVRLVEKVLYLSNPKKEAKASNKTIPMEYSVYTHEYLGRDQRFYSQLEWKVRAELIKAAQKKTIANFGRRV